VKASVLAEAVHFFAGGAVAGLTTCLNTWYDLGKPGGGAFRCKVTLHWINVGSYPVPENVEFGECFYDARKSSRYDCTTVYALGLQLGLS
jgi:hypothetical protein